MKKYAELKLGAVWLTTVSGLVLLSGCQTYHDFQMRFFGMRPPQEVQDGRRMPLMNSQYVGMGRGAQAPSPAMAPPPVMANTPPSAATMRPMTPYDMYDENGSTVSAGQEMQPQLVPPATPVLPAPPRVPAGDDAHFASSHDMNLPATGAYEKPEGNFFTRLFGWNNGSKDDYAVRKPIPGNPHPNEETYRVAPVPPGPLTDRETTQPEQPLLEVKPPVIEPVIEDTPGSKVVALPPSHSAPPSLPAPQGDLPLVEALPLDPDALKQPLPQEEPVLSPQSRETAPAPEPVAMTSAPEKKAEETVAHKDADIFMPKTDFQTQEEGEAVVISSLSDEKADSPSWFERVFGDSGNASPAAADTGDAPAPAELAQAEGRPRTWIERQLGFEDEKPPEQQQPYPSFSSVPPTPARYEEMKQSSQQQVREMESARDQAQESKMELGSEPSSRDMVEMQAPVRPQLLGQMSSPAEQGTAQAIEAPEAPETAPAPEPITPLMAQPVLAEPVDVTPPVAATVTPPLAAPIHMDEPPAPQPPAPVADDEGGVIFPDAVKARQEAEAAAAETAGPPPAAGLPSPQLLDEVRVLPPSRYMNRRQQP